jgi:hypothetical protein
MTGYPAVLTMHDFDPSQAFAQVDLSPTCIGGLPDTVSVPLYWQPNPPTIPLGTFTQTAGDPSTMPIGPNPGYWFGIIKYPPVTYWWRDGGTMEGFFSTVLCEGEGTILGSSGHMTDNLYLYIFLTRCYGVEFDTNDTGGWTLTTYTNFQPYFYGFYGDNNKYSLSHETPPGINLYFANSVYQKPLGHFTITG